MIIQACESPDLCLEALSVLTHVCRELGRPDLLTAAAEKAAQGRPRDEELANYLFMGLVRLGDFKRQQKVR